MFVKFWVFYLGEKRIFLQIPSTFWLILPTQPAILVHRRCKPCQPTCQRCPPFACCVPIQGGTMHSRPFHRSLHMHRALGAWMGWIGRFGLKHAWGDCLQLYLENVCNAVTTSRSLVFARLETSGNCFFMYRALSCFIHVSPEAWTLRHTYFIHNSVFGRCFGLQYQAFVCVEMEP